MKHSKCKFSLILKSTILVFHVGINGVQPLPEKVTAIKALKPPKDIDELRQFLGLISFYRKFIPFFADVTACPHYVKEGSGQNSATMHLKYLNLSW